MTLRGGMTLSGPRDGCGERARAGGSLARLVIVVEDPVYRAGIRAIVAGHPLIEVVDEFDTPPRVVRDAAGLPVDVVVVGWACLDQDLRAMLGGLGRGGHREPVVIALLRPGDEVALRNAVRCCARGLVDASTSHRDLGHAVVEVFGGRTYLSSSIAEVLLGWMGAWITQEPAQGVDLAGLTARELEVLALLGEGITNTQIARRLLIREATVRSHIYHILTKLRLRTRTEAVLVGHRYALNRLEA